MNRSDGAFGRRGKWEALGAVIGLSAVVATAAAQWTEPITVEIDATDLPRMLLYGTETIPLSDDFARSGGDLSLWYPMWIPGTHGPGGPVQNIGGLVMTDGEGNRIEWTREPGEVYRVNAHVPKGTEELVIEIRYITNQSSTNSRGVDSYGSELIGFISPNTVVFYPDGAKANELQIRSSLLIPDDWSAISALIEIEDGNGSGEDADDEPNVIEYEPATLETWVDSPIMLGRYMKAYDLLEKKAKERDIFPPHTMSVFSEAESVIDVPDGMINLFKAMVTQTALLLESAHFDHFDILVATSNSLGRNGLEHMNNTFNVIGQRSLQSVKSFKGWDEYLIPHEYIHAWCGKYRRPAGMVTPDFHTPKDTELLWVYEGLAQHLGELINVRCGMTSEEEYRWSVQSSVRGHRLRQGREWRPLSDTAAASHILRAGSRNWSSLRRGQDYYGEGAIYWLEADAIIRRLTDNEKSLDDFCRAFFRYREDQPKPLGFAREEVVETLNSVVEHDWDTFLRERIEEPSENFVSRVASELGYTIEFTNDPPEGPDGARYDELDMRDSIGASFSGNGGVRSVMLGSPADKAGLGPDMEIVGVGEYVWSGDRMIDALAATAETGTIELMLVSGDKYITKTIEYDGGPRYMVLVRDNDKPDRLADILKPLKIPE